MAWSLVPAILESGHEITGIYGRNTLTLNPLVDRFGLPAFHSLENIPQSDLVFIAVTDSAIAEVSTVVAKENIVVHCSGSTGIDVLAQRFNNCGVVYPTQTFSKHRKADFKNIPLLVEYSSPEAGVVIMEFAKSLSNDVREMTSSQRIYLHLAAVFACNFTNHFFAVAKNILDDNNVDFGLLYPLINETVEKALKCGNPAKCQTGPAVRQDNLTLEKHINLLEPIPYLKDIYISLSQSIIKFKQNGNTNI